MELVKKIGKMLLISMAGVALYNFIKSKAPSLPLP